MFLFSKIFSYPLICTGYKCTCTFFYFSYQILWHKRLLFVEHITLFIGRLRIIQYRILLNTLKPRWLAHRWFVYEYLGKFSYFIIIWYSKSTPTRNNLIHVLTSTFRHHGFFTDLQFGFVLFFYHGIVCCVYSLESPHRFDSNEYTQLTIIV